MTSAIRTDCTLAVLNASRTSRLALALSLVVTGLAVAVFAVVAILAEEGGDDPVVVALTEEHGLHRRDLPEAGLVGAGVVAVLLGVRLSRRLP